MTHTIVLTVSFVSGNVGSFKRSRTDVISRKMRDLPFSIFPQFTKCLVVELVDGGTRRSTAETSGGSITFIRYPSVISMPERIAHVRRQPRGNEGVFPLLCLHSNILR